MFHWWPKSLRRFSLRSLLVVMTIACGICAVVCLHLRNRGRVQAIKQHVAAAGGRSYVFGYNRRLQLASSFTANLDLHLSELSPSAFDSLEKVPALIDTTRNQRVESVILWRGRGEVDWKRTQSLIDSLAPRDLLLNGIRCDEAAALINGRKCKYLFLKSSAIPVDAYSIDLHCEELQFSGPGFDLFWQRVTSQSTVSKVYLTAGSPNEVQNFHRIPSLKDVRLDAGHWDECDVCQLMAKLDGVFVRLKCCGLNEEQKLRLESAFVRYLILEVRDCNCTSTLDPFG